MKKFAIPSRDDAWDLTRGERASVTFLMNAASAIIDAKEDLSDRLKAIDGGEELMDQVAEGCVKLLTEVRRTIPERQRTSLANTAEDYEMRLVPKLTPSKTSVIVQKEDFRCLVDAAQAKCRQCVEDSRGAKQCDLYKLLVTILPLDEYPEMNLCPYNMAWWEN